MKLHFLPRILLCLATAVAVAIPLPSAAQLFRSYLSPTGNDANPCTVSAPCRLLPAALNAVADGGEVWILESGNYNTGPVSVTKSATILAVPGVLGSVVALGGNALVIGTAGVKVTLRNLDVRPFPGNTAMTGISMTAGSALTLEGCNVSGFSGGFAMLVSTAAQVAINDTRIRNNAHGLAVNKGATVRIVDSHFTGNTNAGVLAQAVADDPVTHIAATRVVASNNRSGFSILAPTAGGFARLAITDSLIESNTVGVEMLSVAASAAEVGVANSVLTRNGTGLSASGFGAKAVISGNSVVLNGTGLSQASSAVIETAGNNTVRANSTPVSGSTTPVGTM